MQIRLKLDLGNVFLGRLSFANLGVNIGDGIGAGEPSISANDHCSGTCGHVPVLCITRDLICVC